MPPFRTPCHHFADGQYAVGYANDTLVLARQVQAGQACTGFFGDLPNGIGINREEAQQLRTVTDEFNSAIAAACAAAGDRVHYVGVAEALNGHGCATTGPSWFRCVLQPPAAELFQDFHPIEAGNAAYFDAVKPAVLDTATKCCDTQSRKACFKDYGKFCAQPRG